MSLSQDLITDKRQTGGARAALGINAMNRGTHTAAPSAVNICSVLLEKQRFVHNFDQVVATSPKGSGNICLDSSGTVEVVEETMGTHLLTHLLSDIPSRRRKKGARHLPSKDPGQTPNRMEEWDPINRKSRGRPSSFACFVPFTVPESDPPLLPTGQESGGESKWGGKN